MIEIKIIAIVIMIIIPSDLLVVIMIMVEGLPSPLHLVQIFKTTIQFKCTNYKTMMIMVVIVLYDDQ